MVEGRSNKSERVRYYQNGSVKMRCGMKNNVPHGMCRTWYEDGTLKSKGEFLLGKKFGLWQDWFPNGVLKTYCHYWNGKLQGEIFLYYPDGQIQATGPATRGLRDGLWTFYYQNGNLKKTTKLRGELQVGHCNSFHPNGKLHSVGSYDNQGRQTGWWEFWNEEGERVTSYQASKGNLHGPSIVWKKGKEYRVDLFHHGELERTIKREPLFDRVKEKVKQRIRKIKKSEKDAA